jgi:hypothetical protein
MNTLMLRKWKDNGFLDALLDGKLQVNKGNSDSWGDITNDGFELNNDYKYRIKPKFEVGDLVKTQGTVGKISTYDGLKYQVDDLINNNHFLINDGSDFVKVRRILKPHTFETAVKDCAENDLELMSGKITGLTQNMFYLDGMRMYYNGDYFYFLNNKPFCQVEYEEC